MTNLLDWANAAAKIRIACTRPEGNAWHLNWGITQHEFQLISNGHCTICNLHRKDA